MRTPGGDAATSMSRRNLALGVALAGLGLMGALLPLAITRGPVRPPLINADGPLPRTAGLRGPYLNRWACLQQRMEQCRTCVSHCADLSCRAWLCSGSKDIGPSR